VEHTPFLGEGEVKFRVLYRDNLQFNSILTQFTVLNFTKTPQQFTIWNTQTGTLLMGFR